MGRESIYGAATAAMRSKQQREEDQAAIGRELAYRRGIDQGVFFVLDYLGLTTEQILELRWKISIADWRARLGSARGPWPGVPSPTPDAIEQLREFVAAALAPDIKGEAE